MRLLVLAGRRCGRGVRPRHPPKRRRGRRRGHLGRRCGCRGSCGCGCRGPAASPILRTICPGSSGGGWRNRARRAGLRPQLSVEERKAERAKQRKAKADLRRKQRAAAKAAHEAGTGTPPAEREANAAKVRQGIVVSNKGDKSITVRIDIARRHPTYEKIVRRSRTLHAHDERNEAGEGDVVRVVETRPLSKTKRWRLVDVVEKAR